MPYDFFTIGIAEVLISAGKTEEGEKLINDVINTQKNILIMQSVLNLRTGMVWNIQQVLTCRVYSIFTIWL